MTPFNLVLFKEHTNHTCYYDNRYYNNGNVIKFAKNFLSTKRNSQKSITQDFGKIFTFFVRNHTFKNVYSFYISV